MKFINNKANVEDWGMTLAESPEYEWVEVGPVGKYGACCAEFDILEANNQAIAITSHPCTIEGLQTCSGAEDLECGNKSKGLPGFCDKDGCGLNPYRMGEPTFYGPGSKFTLDTSKPFTVVTQFVTEDGTDEGALVDIRRKYVQDGQVIENAVATVLDEADQGNSLTDDLCSATVKKFNVTKKNEKHHTARKSRTWMDTFKLAGGTKAMGEAIGRGMVMSMSVWDDGLGRMNWLDSEKTLIDEDCLGGLQGAHRVRVWGLEEEKDKTFILEVLGGRDSCTPDNISHPGGHFKAMAAQPELMLRFCVWESNGVERQIEAADCSLHSDRVMGMGAIFFAKAVSSAVAVAETQSPVHSPRHLNFTEVISRGSRTSALLSEPGRLVAAFDRRPGQVFENAINAAGLSRVVASALLPQPGATLWISPFVAGRSFLRSRRYRRTIDEPAGGVEIPEVAEGSAMAAPPALVARGQRARRQLLKRRPGAAGAGGVSGIGPAEDYGHGLAMEAPAVTLRYSREIQERNEWCVMKATVSTVDTDGRWHVRCLLRDPVEHWTLFSEARGFLETLRSRGATGIVVNHCCWDRGEYDTQVKWMRARHVVDNASVMDDDARHLLDLLAWDVGTPCAAHDAHEALCWATERFVADPKAMSKELWIVVHSLKNSSAALKSWIPSVLNEVEFHDLGAEDNDVQARWKTLGLDPELVDELTWAAPRVAGNRLHLHPRVLQDANWQERVTTLVMAAFQWTEDAFEVKLRDKIAKLRRRRPENDDGRCEFFKTAVLAQTAEAQARADIDDDLALWEGLLNLHLARKGAEQRDMGIMHRLTDCRLTDDELQSVCLMWEGCEATASQVASLRQAALAPVVVLPPDLKDQYRRVPTPPQFPDQCKDAPAWGKMLARHRDHMRCTALHVRTPASDRWFAFTYARQRPHTASFCEMTRLPEEPPERVATGAQAEQRELTSHAFVWNSQFIYRRDIDFQAVDPSHISVVPFLTFASNGRCFSDFVEMPLEEWFAQMPALLRRDTEETDDALPEWITPYDFVKRPWLIEHLARKAGESSEDEGGPPAPAPPRAAAARVEPKVDDIFKYTMDKQLEHVVALAPRVPDFVVILRKGKTALEKTGLPIDFARGQGGTPEAKKWLQDRAGTRTFDASWRQFGEWKSIALCQFWCYKMQYLFDALRGYDLASHHDEGGAVKDPDILTELIRQLADGAPHWGRIEQEQQAAGEAMLSTPAKAQPGPAGTTPVKRSLFERAEQAEFGKSSRSSARARSQVGRNAGDAGKLAAIKAHFGKIEDDVLYGVVRQGKNLWQRVCDDWAQRESEGKKKHGPGYWPTLKSLYLNPEKIEGAGPQATVDPELLKGIESYGASTGKRSSNVLFTWFDTVQTVNPATFAELAKFVRGLTPLTVTLDKEATLKVMDLVNRAGLRTTAYLESFIDMMDIFDLVLLQLLGMSKRDKRGLRSFFQAEGSRLGLLMDMDMAWAIIDEQTDMARHIGHAVLLSGQCKTAEQAFKATKNDVVVAHLSAFVRQEVKTWDGHRVTKAVVERAREACLQEAKRVNAFLGEVPERKVDLVLAGQDIQMAVTTFGQEVELALHCGKKNRSWGKGLVALWLEAGLVAQGREDDGSTVGETELAGYNTSRGIMNELAESLSPTLDGAAVIRFLLSRSSRWLTHDPSGMCDVAWLRKFAGQAGADSMWLITKTKLPHPAYPNDAPAILASLRDFHESRVAGFCGRAPKSEVKTIIDAIQQYVKDERITPETVNIADAAKKREALERISHLYHKEVTNDANGMTVTLTGAKALKHLLGALQQKVAQGDNISVNDTMPLKVLNYVLDEDDQKLRLRITEEATTLLREQSAAGVVDAATMQVVESLGVVDAPRMHPKEMLSVVPAGPMSEGSASSTGAERRAKIARVASVFLKKQEGA
ncbi:unnamed protein product [Prorocentrum cordatum]|uniref:cellulase n=1 Tax=Prorocentrum cordatum TaxID=2364126 RepID=A0ABN9Q2A2_9DINO|nr:unnamed protein product [Polarella glacialis]